ncbi:MAG TPA: FAD-dependent oxidoreductase [Caulobacteraceae bacterium]|nr:FAD-dependent oxidoreductase [Caulobacteraceae bacterium]
MSACDFLVCGAGIAGVSIAAELAQAASVVVAERESAAGHHTTGRSAALYVASYGNADIRALTAASRPFFDAPPPGFADHPLLTPRGCLHVGDSSQSDALDALEAEIAAAGADVRRIGGQAACAMVEVLRPEAVAGGVLEPGAADIDVAALHGGYLRLARQRGARIALGAGIVALERADAGWRARLANAETLDARVVVNAAGAWGDELAALAGVAPVGLAPLRRTAIILEAPANLAIGGWPAVIDVDEGFYFKPEAGRILASPADETPSPPTDAAPDELDIALCIERLQAVADIPVRRVLRAWAGLRTFAPDRSPVIGYAPGRADFFWFAGQGGYGMQIAPAAARLGSALARGDRAPADIGAAGLGIVASPERFS